LAKSPAFSWRRRESTELLRVNPELTDDRRGRQSLSMTVKYHDDFPKLGHRTAPAASGFQPTACRPYWAKTKGKAERPYRHIREDFFFARSFRNLDDLNPQLRHWLNTVANPRVRVVDMPLNWNFPAKIGPANREQVTRHK
jgi:hypothetical protein